MKANVLGLTVTTCACLLIVGCSEDVKSTDVRTSGVYAAMNITSDNDNSANIDVELKVGGASSNTYLSLSGEDKLVAYLNDSVTGQTLSKSKDDITGEITYKTSFSSTGSGAQSAKYRVAFERSANDTSAPNSTITLPAGFSNLTADKTTFSRLSDALTLTWAAGDATKRINLSITGDCVNTSTFTPVDNGSYVINAGTVADSSSTPSNCNVTFTLSRKVDGSLDSAYGEGGYISATKSLAKTIASTP